MEEKSLWVRVLKEKYGVVGGLLNVRGRDTTRKSLISQGQKS